MLSQRRRHSRWRMSLIFVVFLGLTCNSEAASADVFESSSSAPTGKRKSQDISSLSDISWQAWLLVDAQNGLQRSSDFAKNDSQKKIPKSVFIAPKLDKCADNYTSDAMGRCTKDVNINPKAQMDFILQRLNAKFRPSDFKNKNDQRKSTGPLQLNIPLILSDPKPSSTKIELDETFSISDPFTVPSRTETHSDDEEKTRPHEVTITSQYDVKNDTILHEEETTFHVENSSTDNVSGIQKFETVLPKVDFVVETNDTTSSEVVDHKIPIYLKTSLNISSVKRLNASDVTRNVSVEAKPQNFTDLPPTLILLIPSTKSPSIANNLPITQNETASDVTVQISNVASNETAKEVIAVSVPDFALPSTDKSEEVPSIATDEQRDNETYADDETATESSKLNESQETEFDYDEEEEDAEYLYSTDVPEEEDSVELENEEILRHGEAGMTIPTQNVDRLHRDQQQQNQTISDQKKALEVGHQIMIRFNDSMPTEDKDEAGSNVSSEVSIDGDLILETTLLDVNTEKLQVTTQPPNVIRKTTKSSENSSKVSFGKGPNTEPEVVFSQEAHGTTFTSLNGRKRTEPFRFENKKNEELTAALSSSEFFSSLHNLPGKSPITEISTIKNNPIDKEQSTVKESSTLQENSNNFQFPNVPANEFKQTTMNLGSDYVRFPDYVKQPQQDGYVRFPSSEVNSILGYKQHLHRPIDDVGPHDDTKNSVPVRQKPVYLSSWRPEEPSDYVPRKQEEDMSDLLHFWSKMPLFRDPDISTGQVPHQEATSQDTQELPRDRYLRASRSRKLNLFTPETSAENVNRVPTQKQRLPIDG